MKLRKLTSTFLVFLFIPLLISSIVLYITPHGRVAYWADWKFIFLSKTKWGDLHTNLGFLFILAGLIHTLLNLKVIFHYLKSKIHPQKPSLEVIVSGFCVLFLCVGTLMEIPPVSAIQIFGGKIKDNAAITYGEPPYGHAELSSLEIFCQRTGLPLEEAEEKIKKRTLVYKNSKQTIIEISRENQISPQDFYKIISDGVKNQSAKSAGIGKKTLKEMCERYNFDPQKVQKFLESQAISCQLEENLKVIAQNNGIRPNDIHEMILNYKEYVK